MTAREPLQELVDTLSAIGADDDLFGANWTDAVIEAFLMSPVSEALDDWLYEVLLQ